MVPSLTDSPCCTHFVALHVLLSVAARCLIGWFVPQGGGRSGYGGSGGVSSHRIQDAYHFLLDTLAVQHTEHSSHPEARSRLSLVSLTAARRLCR